MRGERGRRANDDSAANIPSHHHHEVPRHPSPICRNEPQRWEEDDEYGDARSDNAIQGSVSDNDHQNPCD